MDALNANVQNMPMMEVFDVQIVVVYQVDIVFFILELKVTFLFYIHLVDFKLPNISFDLNSITKYIQAEWPDVKVMKKESDKWTLKIQQFTERLPHLNLSFPNADQKSALLIDFKQRLHLASQTFLILGILGILGFRGRTVHSPFLTSLYPVVLVCSLLGCIVSLYSCNYF